MRCWKKLFFILATLIFVFFVVATAFSAPAANYAISKFTVEGGVYSWQTGSAYTLGGAAGEYAAGLVSGGDYQLGGGSWPGGSVFEKKFLYLPITVR
jgi:uncharacterized membrane protein